MALDLVVAPAHLWVPEHSGSAAAEAIGLAESVGLYPDAEQRLALEALLAERENGQWAAIENTLIAARQNLKTFVFRVIALFELWVVGVDLVSWSAHLFPTAQEAFRELTDIALNYDHLRRRVKKVSNENGSEGIELLGGSRIQFRARTRTGGRGLSGDTIFFDEAFALIAAMMGSLFPTLSAKPNPHVFYGSSAGLAGSELLRNLRDRGRPGGDPSLAYVEWCSERRPCASERCDHRVGAEGCVLDDPEMWRAANPALERRISLEYIRAERRALPPAEFMRERLGWWDDPEDSTDGIPMERWYACSDADSEIVGGIVFAISVAHDLSWSTIAAAGDTFDGLVHAEVVEYRSGTDWVATRAAELLEEHGGTLYFEVGGPRSTVGDELDALGIDFVDMPQAELVAACGVFYDLILRGALRHLDQPELTYAIKGGRRRPVGEAWTWARRASLPIEISPAVAATISVAAVARAGPNYEVLESIG